MALVMPVRANDNGLAREPVMGWRSWYSNQFNMDETVWRNTVDTLTDASLSATGLSLKDVGYEYVGQDDGWQGCLHPNYGNDPRGSGGWHDADGTPRLNTTKYPNLTGAVAYAHSHGLKADWYLNNCYCSDPSSADKYFEGDVKFIRDHKFNAVKIDGCGGERDIAKFADLFNKSGGAPIVIQDCHDSRASPNKTVPRAPPNATWCPFHSWRNSYDEHYTLYDTALFLMMMNSKNNANVSRPGCWAMAGMLMAGVNNNVSPGCKTQNTCVSSDVALAGPPMLPHEARSQFGAYCVLSSPLIISMDPLNITTLKQHLPYLMNREAIRINKEWAGEPGALFSQSAETTPMYCFQPDRKGNPSCTYSTTQVWKKDQLGGQVAVLLVNNGNSSNDVTANLTALGFGCSASKPCVAHDVWSGKNSSVGAASYTAKGLISHDSALVRFFPASSLQ